MIYDLQISDLKHGENVKLSCYIQQTEHNTKSASKSAKQKHHSSSTDGTKDFYAE